MSDHDPFADDEFEPVRPEKGRKKADLRSLDPGLPDEDASVNEILAFSPLNDLGNASRLQTRFGEDLMYVNNIGWFVWDEARWDRENGEAEAIKRGHKVSLAIRKEAVALRDKKGKDYDDLVGKLYQHSRQSGNMSAIGGMLRAAAPYLSVHIDLLDAQPRLVAAPNFTIELRTTVEARPPHREDRQTRVLGVPYQTNVDCPLWEKFLEEVQPDALMRAFLQRWMGYCLTGLTGEHKLMINYGMGRNGKSVFVNVMRHIFHQYATSLPAASILAKQNMKSGSEATPDLADLPGVRLVTIAEPPEGGRLDESRVKEMTGGEYRQKARELNKGFFEFIPRYKIMMSTNYRPLIRGIDKGIWSRILLVPWTTHITEDRIDVDLEAKLIREAPGILQWLLSGVEDYLANGLDIPERVRKAVEDYRADQDSVGEFLKTCCEVCPEVINPSTGRVFEVTAKRLREVYVEWCKEEGIEPMAGKTFGSKLTGRGIERRKTGGNTVYVGLSITRDTMRAMESEAQ